MEIWNHFPLKRIFYAPLNMVQNEHPVDVRFAPTEAERRHKIEASASRYANIGANCKSTKHDTIHMASLSFTTLQ